MWWSPCYLRTLEKRDPKLLVRGGKRGRVKGGDYRGDKRVGKKRRGYILRTYAYSKNKYMSRARFIILAHSLSRSAPGSLLSLTLQLAGCIYHALRFRLALARRVDLIIPCMRESPPKHHPPCTNLPPASSNVLLPLLERVPTNKRPPRPRLTGGGERSGLTVIRLA